jgi:Holliday junction resolvase RusA-like endonuclease
VLQPQKSEASPPEAANVILDLPPPLSANKTRRIDWRAHARHAEWKKTADVHVLIAKRRRDNPIKLARIPKFEITIILDEALTGIDLDNSLKVLLDFLVEREVVKDDGRKCMRKVTIIWGDGDSAPEGTRVIVTPLP